MLLWQVISYIIIAGCSPVEMIIIWFAVVVLIMREHFDYYRIADVGGWHGFSFIVDIFKLAVDEIVVGALAGANAMIDVFERQHPARWLGHETHRRVGSHSSLAGAQCGRFTAILFVIALISPSSSSSLSKNRRKITNKKSVKRNILRGSST